MAQVCLVLAGLALLAFSVQAAIINFENDVLGKEYLFDNETKRNAQGAVTFCRTLNATLITIRSAAESSWILSNVPANTAPGKFILGVQNAVGTSRPLTFLDASTIDFYNWKSAYDTGRYDCVTLTANPSDQYKWDRDSCVPSTTWYVACERPLTTEILATRLDTTGTQLNEKVKAYIKQIADLVKENSDLKRKINDSEVSHTALVNSEKKQYATELETMKAKFSKDSETREQKFRSLLKQFGIKFRKIHSLA